MAAALSLLAFVNSSNSTGFSNIGIASANGVVNPFRVELALTAAQKSRGLMGREYLAKNQGMLFVYDSPSRLAFWMKDTLIPLDVLFFNKKGELVFIYPNAKPGSLAPVGPDRQDVCLVLEVAGGEAQRLGLDLGDKIILDFQSECLQ